MAVGDKKGGAIADINVTPMADIMIVLLIIFMVITPMLQKGVDVKLPIASNTKERKDEQKTIIVAIKKDGTVYLKADSDLEYSEVMKVMDLLREAGVEEVALIAESRVQGS
jgi:biopolymer transport protein ExbD